MNRHNDPICSEESGAPDASLRIVSRIKTPPGLCQRTVGFTVGPLATVSYGRVMELAIKCGTAPFLILGWAMTHEIGHVLLRTGAHSPEGIMREELETEQARAVVTNDVFFTPEQSEFLRTETLARNKGQQVRTRDLFSNSTTGVPQKPRLLTSPNPPQAVPRVASIYSTENVPQNGQ